MHNFRVFEIKYLALQTVIVPIEKHQEPSHQGKLLTLALLKQGRKVLLLDLDAGRSEDTLLHGRASITSENINYKCLGKDETPTSAAVLKQLLATYKANYDLIIVCNEPIELQSKGLLFMNAAEANLFIVDSRNTAAKQITRAEIMTHEFSLPSMWFGLNRAGYNPNVIYEFFGWVKKQIARVKSFQQAKR